MARNISYNRALMEAIAKTQASASVELAKNEEIVSKLTDYYIDHENDDDTDPVSDRELLDAGYRTLGEVRSALPGLSLENENLWDQLFTITDQLNNVSAKAAEDQSKVDANDDAESSNKNLEDLES